MIKRAVMVCPIEDVGGEDGMGASNGPRGEYGIDQLRSTTHQ